MSMHRAARLAAMILTAAVPLAAQKPAPKKPSPKKPPIAKYVAPLTTQFHVPVEYFTLGNGLRVVMSRDSTAPTVAVGVYYRVGFRTEPRDRTGFAHLFEHLMFQGSGNLGKLEFIKLIESNGGILNGSTRFDFTNYYELVPSNTLETILWAEADRMKGLAIDTASINNQRDVVKNEVRVNVKNQPYGSFPWIDVPMVANTNWANAHDFYGDFKDLDAASLANAAAFFRTYYAPNNAVLAIVGDFSQVQARAWVEKYFGDIPASNPAPTPDLSEPPQLAERIGSRVDSLANRPALAVAWHMPPRFTPEWYAMGIIDQLMGQGRDSRLYDALVQQKSLTGDVSAGINWGLGNQFDYAGPMLWMITAYHDSDKPSSALLDVFNAEFEALRTLPLDPITLARAKTKMKSALYAAADEQLGLGKLNLLASFALFDGEPGRINQLDAGFAAVTPQLILKTAQDYLRLNQRTVYTIIPGAKSASGGGR